MEAFKDIGRIVLQLHFSLQGSRGDPLPWAIDGLVETGSQGSMFPLLSLPVFLGTHACEDIGKIPGVYGMIDNRHWKV